MRGPQRDCSPAGEHRTVRTLGGAREVYGHTAMTKFWPMGKADSVCSMLEPSNAAGQSGRWG